MARTRPAGLHFLALMSAITMPAAATSTTMPMATAMISGTLTGICTPSGVLEVTALALVFMVVFLVLTGLAALTLFDLCRELASIGKAPGHPSRLAAAFLQGAHRALTMLALLMVPIGYHASGQSHTSTASTLALGVCHQGGFLTLDQGSIVLLSASAAISFMVACFIHFVVWHRLDQAICSKWSVKRASGHS